MSTVQAQIWVRRYLTVDEQSETFTLIHFLLDIKSCNESIAEISSRMNVLLITLINQDTSATAIDIILLVDGQKITKTADRETKGNKKP